MAEFQIALEKTLACEGGYAYLGADTESKHDDDTGGQTIFGISQNNHPKSPLWNELENYKKILAPFDKSKYSKLETLCKNNAIIVREMETIYKEQYWYKVRGDFLINQDNANVLFDMAVNAGVSRAVKLAQEIVGVSVDGICGRLTQNAINAYGIPFCNVYVEKRIKWYSERKNKTYIKAWIARAEKFRV